jgi:hypothetical protein
MRIVRTVTMATFCVLAGMILATGLLPALHTPSYAEPLVRSAPPQYWTAAVDADSLEDQINDLARDHWEIVSITTASSYAIREEAFDPRIITEKFQVTARRPWSPPPPRR